MFLKSIGYAIAPAILLAMLQPAMAGHRGRCHRGGSCGSYASTCSTCGTACETQYQEVTKTIMVPKMETETRTINVTECVPEQRERTYTVYNRVNETKDVSYEYTVNVPETRTRTVNYTVCKPVTRDVEQQYTVSVPYTETRQATRRVCELVPVTMTRTVCEDQGHWEEVPCQTAAPNCSNCTANENNSKFRRVGYRKRGRGAYGDCGDCASGCATGCASPAPCTTACTQRHWVSNIVKREVEYTCNKPQMKEVPYEYTVNLCRQETRTRTVQVCDMVCEAASKEVEYTVCVPQTRTGTRQVSYCRMVPEEKTCTYTVNVPHTVQKEVQVQVCKMVAKEVTCRVPVNHCASCQ